jgi:hypothetical protein
VNRIRFVYCSALLFIGTIASAEIQAPPLLDGDWEYAMLYPSGKFEVTRLSVKEGKVLDFLFINENYDIGLKAFHATAIERFGRTFIVTLSSAGEVGTRSLLVSCDDEPCVSLIGVHQQWARPTPADDATNHVLIQDGIRLQRVVAGQESDLDRLISKVKAIEKRVRR